MSDIEEVLREALKGVQVRYAPGIGAYQPVSQEEIMTGGWRGQYVWPARRDPIFTPIFTAILGTGGFTLFGTTISYAAIASAIATTALTIGVSALLAPKPPKPEDGRAPLTQSIPYRLWGVGQCRLAGAYMLWEAVDDKMVSVQVIVAHKINRFTSFYLNDDKVTLGGDGVSVNGINGRYSEGRVKIFQRLGEVPETAISQLVNLINNPNVWTTDHRGDGQASLGMLCRAPDAKHFQRRFPYGKPALSAVAELALVWDFRDPAQDPRNDKTWKFSRNSALILCWHECFNPFGTKRDYRRAILPVLDMWKEEAEVCDENVPLAGGGTEKRYECNGYDTTEHDPKAATNAILASCDGWMCERGDGALLFVAGKFREKYVATLTDADIVGHQVQYDVLPEDEINRLVPKFCFPATDYTTTDTDYFEDTAAQLVAGRVLSQDADLRWVQQWRQARRLGKREWLRAQAKKRGTLDVRLSGINAVYAPWIRLSAPKRLPGLDGKVVSNRKSILALTKGGFQIAFIQLPDDPATIDAWDPLNDEGSAPPVPGKPVSEGIPVAVIDSVAVISNGTSTYLHINTIDPNRDDLTVVVRYRMAAVGTGNPGGWIEQRFPDAVPNAGLISIDTNTVTSNATMDVEANFIGADDSYGEDWSDTESVTTTLDDTPPQALLSFSAGDGTGQFVANFGTENDGHLSTVAIYKVASGGTLDRAADIVAQPAVAPGISYALPIAADPGTYDIYAEPFNRSAIAGLLSGPDEAIVS